MLRHMSRLLPVLLTAVMTLAACPRAGPDPDNPFELSPRATQEVTGLITDIDGNRMSLRAEDGTELVFTLEEPPPVSIDHLRDHMVGRLPVIITYRIQGTRLVPVTIGDA